MASAQDVAATTASYAGDVTEFTRLEHATVGALYMIFGVGGAVSNLLLLLTLLKERGVLGGGSPCFHLSLALANIAIVAPAPFPASSALSGRWLYGDRLCQAYAFEGMFVGIFSIGCIICLCLERYVIASRTESTPPKALSFYLMMTSLNLANAGFWALMPLLGWSRYALDHTRTSCAIDWREADDGYVSYMSSLCLFSFFLPVLLALLALYKAGHVTATSATRSGLQADVSGQETATSGLAEPCLRGPCLTLLLLALAAWGPFAVLCLWAMVGQASKASMLAAALPPLTCKFMTMAYPLAYNLASPRLRSTYLSLLGLGPDQDNAAKKE